MTTDAIYMTARLTVRPLRGSDGPRLMAFGGRPEVARMVASLKSPWPEADIREWIARAAYRGRVGFRAGICLPGAGLIGFVGLGGAPASCGYAIDPDHAGKGYATEALIGLAAFAFDHLGIDEITADHFTDNPASARVLAKTGFTKTGTGMGQSLARAEPAPVHQWRLTAAGFRALHPS